MPYKYRVNLTVIDDYEQTADNEPLDIQDIKDSIKDGLEINDLTIDGEISITKLEEV